MDKHDLYGVLINSTLLGGIIRQEINTNSVHRGEPASGAINPSVMSVVDQIVGASFATLDIETALGELTGDSEYGQFGWTITGDGLSMYGYKHVDGGGRAGASSHRKYNFVKGLVIPQTLSVSHGGDAVLSYRVFPAYNGSADPVVLTEDQSVPGSITDANRYTLGPCTVGNISLDGLRGLDIDFGIAVEQEPIQSEVWPRVVSIRSAAPVITIRGIDLAWHADSGGIPLEGLAGTHANSTIYLRRRKTGGSFYADNEAEHVKFTAAGLITVQNMMSADGRSAAEASLMMSCYHDGDNLPLSVDTSIAIT